MQRVFRVIETSGLEPTGVRSTTGFDRNVAQHGIVIPIMVAEVVDDDGVVSTVIIDGNRRVRAAKAAGMATIPAVVLSGTTADERDRLTLITNHLRSNNFQTESLAVAALAGDENGAKRLAQALGLSAVKVQGLLRKLDGMPDEVRTAMFEERVAVSVATAIAGYPAPLQDRLVALLLSRGGLDTPTVEGERKRYERDHPPARAAAASVRRGPVVEPWMEEDMATFAPPPATVPAAAPPDGRAQNVGSEGVAAPPGAPAATDETAPATDDPRVFIARVDAALLAQARAVRAHNLPRSVWVDRAIRAWDLAEEEGDRT